MVLIPSCLSAAAAVKALSDSPLHLFPSKSAVEFALLFRQEMEVQEHFSEIAFLVRY